ncbi:hypothetical protein K438DRAFT_1593853, partial [Mycena galopus ATCC 62051]
TDVFLLCFSVVLPPSPTRSFSDVHHHCPRASFLICGTQIDLRDNHEVINTLARSTQRPVSECQGLGLPEEMGAAKGPDAERIEQHLR